MSTSLFDNELSIPEIQDDLPNDPVYLTGEGNGTEGYDQEEVGNIGLDALAVQYITLCRTENRA